MQSTQHKFTEYFDKIFFGKNNTPYLRDSEQELSNLNLKL